MKKKDKFKFEWTDEDEAEERAKNEYADKHHITLSEADMIWAKKMTLEEALANHNHRNKR